VEQVLVIIISFIYIIMPFIALYYLKRIQLGLNEISKLLLEMKAICERIRIKIKQQ